MTRREQNSMRQALMVLMAGLGLSLACSKPKPPPAPYCGPTLASAELGIEAVPCPVTGYVILEQAPSRGRFPGAVAIAWLTPPEDDATIAGDPTDAWRLGKIKEERATYWTSLFNTVLAIREVVILDTPALEQPDDGIDAIAQAAWRQKADLCVIYGPAAAAPEHAALTGIIMDTHRIEPVAFAQADAGPEDFRPMPEDAYKGDRRHEDVNYLVARKFERQVWECVVELIARDQPATTTQPSPWKGINTTLPSEYPALPVYIIPNQPADW